MVQDELRRIHQMKNSITAVCLHMLRIDRSIAKFFGIGAFFIKRTLGMERDQENANNRDDTALSLDAEQLETLQAAIEVCPDATVEELQRIVADQCKVTVNQMSICRALKQLNLPDAKTGGSIDQFHSHGQQEKSP
jgi:transposase